MTMKWGFMFFLFLVLWAELAAGGVLPKETTHIIDPDMQSTIQSLHEALRSYKRDLKQKSILTSLPDLPCTETIAHLEQSSTLACKLSQYRMCVEQLRSLSTDDTGLCTVVKLNNDLLQHLEGSSQDLVACPSSSSSSSSPVTEFDTLRESVQCVHCWIQQVEALRR